jgi:hypothetical protein
MIQSLCVLGLATLLTTACTTFNQASDYEGKKEERKPASVPPPMDYPVLTCPFLKDLPAHIETFLGNPDSVIEDGKLKKIVSDNVFPDPQKQFENAFSDERFWDYSNDKATELAKFFNFEKKRSQLSSADNNSEWYGNNFLSEYANNLDFVASDLQMALEAAQRMPAPTQKQKNRILKGLSNLNSMMLTPEQMLVQVVNASVGWRFDQDGFNVNQLNCTELETKARETRTGSPLPSNFEHYAYSYIRLREMKKIVDALNWHQE